MRIAISLDLDVNDLNESAIHDLVADLTYEMRSSRRLVDWAIGFDPLEGRP